MNAKRLIILVTLMTLLLSACAAATPQSMAAPTQAFAVQKQVVKTVVVEQQAEAQKPAATAAPASLPGLPAPTQAPVAAAPQSPSNYPAPAPTATPGMPPVPGTVPTPVDNTFLSYGINPFVDTIEDHLSTFALDVDTASYTIARKYIQEGNLPPADAIRVEEFVNYFKQDYPTPENVAFGIYADGAPSPFNYDGTTLLRFGVQGYQVPDYARKSSTLTFVIDVSGSMNMEGRLELVKQALNLLVDRLRPDDTVAIVVYSTNTRIVLNPTRGDDRNTILNAIYALQPEDTTNVEAGLRLGYQLAMQYFRSNTNNRIILCSDGVANVGAVSPEAILAMVQGYVDEGVTLTTIGVGMGNFNDTLLEQLADKGNGNYAYVDTIDEARKVFVDDLTSTLQVIAYDAKVQVDFNPEVVARYRLIGYENRAIADNNFRNDSVDAGEIGAGLSATAIYAVQFKPGVQGRIATVQLRWQDAETRKVTEINGNFNTWDLASTFESASPRFRLAATAAHYAELLRHSPYVSGLSMEQLYRYVYPLYEELASDADVTEFVNLVYRATQIGR